MKSDFTFVRVKGGKYHSINSEPTWALNATAHCGLSITDDEYYDQMRPSNAPLKDRCKTCTRVRERILEDELTSA